MCHLLVLLQQVDSYDYIVCTCRFRVNRTPMYSDEPLFGIRSVYHIVSINYLINEGNIMFY